MGKGLEKMKKSIGRKMVIDIPVGKGRPVEAIPSAKLSNELGIIARNFLSLPNKWKELTREDKDAALIRCHVRILYFGTFYYILNMLVFNLLQAKGILIVL